MMSSNTLPSAEELRLLTTLDSGRATREIAVFWAMMLGVIAVAATIDDVLTYLAGFIAMGCLLNRLITWVHEASHFNLSRDRKKNDLLADLLLAGPAGISVDQYRWHHFPHHRFLGDPSREIELVSWTDIRGKGLLKEILKHFLGLYALQIIARRHRFSNDGSAFPPPPPRSAAAWAGFVAVNSTLFVYCWVLGAWYGYFMLWVAPLFTLALLITNFRTILEHQVLQEGAPQLIKQPSFTRIVEAGILEQELFAPTGFHFHYEHHLYPSVPYYRLSALRTLLQQRGHFERNNVERSRGYVNTLLNLARIRLGRA